VNGQEAKTFSYSRSYTMNIIDTKNWSVRVNKMPSLEGPSLTVTGTIIVGNSATEAVLVLPPVQDKSMGLRLELELEQTGAGATVLTEKFVTYSVAGYDNTTHVTIFSDGKELIRIDDIEVVY
jgi:hypothetical protein